MATIKSNIRLFIDAVHILRQTDSEYWIRYDGFSIIIADMKGCRIELEHTIFDGFESAPTHEIFSQIFNSAVLDTIDYTTTDITFQYQNSLLTIEVGAGEELTTVELGAGESRRVPDDDYMCYMDGDLSWLAQLGEKTLVQWMPNELRFVSAITTARVAYNQSRLFESDITKVRPFRMITEKYPQGPIEMIIPVNMCNGCVMSASFKRIRPDSLEVIKRIAGWGTDHVLECDADKPLHIRAVHDDMISIDALVAW